MSILLLLFANENQILYDNVGMEHIIDLLDYYIIESSDLCLISHSHDKRDMK